VTPLSAPALRPTRPRPAPPAGPYVVAGLARAGQAAARALAARAGPAVVRGWDGVEAERTERARDELRELGIDVVLGGDGRELLDAEPPPRCLVKSPGLPFDAPLVAESARRRLAVIDELELGWRLDRRFTLGITGTNGKSTVAALAAAALERAGRRPAVAGNTVFGPPLSALAPEAADVVVAEVSSLQLEGCPRLLPDVAALTTFSEDHLDRHGTMRAYGEAKRRLFLREHTTVWLAVVGVDDAFGRALARDLEGRRARVLRVAAGTAADYRLEGLVWDAGRAHLTAQAAGERLELVTRLPGEHNALNALIALALADGLGLPRAAALAALAETPAPPGRLEPVASGAPFDVLVDYAHNPAGVRESLRAARAMMAGRPGALRVVACALSIVTPAQRHAMGREAARGADDLVLTTDRTSRDEPPDELPAGLAEGARAAGGAPVEIVPERGEAISRVLDRARPGDVVVLLGRGVRTRTLDREGRPATFDDREEAARRLAALARP
jgi:UDP-N-acetylmuramoyl-L-alanyl-D-glutamate--2,6-diaminopimelate ligase